MWILSLRLYTWFCLMLVVQRVLILQYSNRALVLLLCHEFTTKCTWQVHGGNVGSENLPILVLCHEMLIAIDTLGFPWCDQIAIAVPSTVPPKISKVNQSITYPYIKDVSGQPLAKPCHGSAVISTTVLIFKPII